MKVANMKFVTTLLLLGVLAFASSRKISRPKTSSPKPPAKPPASLLVGPKTTAYFLSSDVSGLKVERKTNIFNTTKYTPVPNTMYVEMLVIYDRYSDVEYYNDEDKMISHAFDLFEGVAKTYQTLKNTTIRIRLAGIVIPRDQNVFNFITRYDFDWLRKPAIDYSYASYEMGEWLYRQLDLFPSDSYDAFMMLTQSPHKYYSLRHPVKGLAHPQGICRIEDNRQVMSRGAIMLDGERGDFTLTASHELAHVFGATHDEENDCAENDDHDTVMHISASPYTTKWSQCTENRFLRVLELARLYPCLANVPEL